MIKFHFWNLDDKKNNQKIDQKYKRPFQVSQFLSENSNSLIVGTSENSDQKYIIYWGISKSRFFQNFMKFGGYF